MTIERPDERGIIPQKPPPPKRELELPDDGDTRPTLPPDETPAVPVDPVREAPAVTPRTAGSRRHRDGRLSIPPPPPKPEIIDRGSYARREPQRSDPLMLLSLDRALMRTGSPLR